MQSVYGQETSVNTMLGQVNSMIGSIGERLGVSGMLSNLIGNVKYTSAANLVGTGLGQAIYEVIDSLVGAVDTAIPFISAAGFGVDLEASVSDLVMGGLGGLALLGSSVATIIQGLGGPAALTNLSSAMWDTTGLAGGAGFTSTSGGAGKSRRLSVGGASGDMTTMEVTEAKSGALQAQGYDEGATAAPENDIDDVYTLIENRSKEIYDLLQEINGNLFGIGTDRKPLLVDINSMPSGMTSGSDSEQSLHVVVTNTELERIPIDGGIGGFGTEISQALSSVGIGG